MGPLIELLRTRQWVKNVFILAPLFFGKNLLEESALVNALAAFSAFCLASSAVYIFNDWRDIDADRAHAKKKFRPLPSGRVSVGAALAVAVLLLAAAVAISVMAHLPTAFLVTLLAYLVINLAYSLGVKHVAVLELFFVASGFVLRLLAGGYAVSVELSPWIVIATGLIALLLTVGKRRGDIARDNDVENRRRSLGGYNLAFLDMVFAALTGATIVVYLLFCASDYATTRYGNDVLITAVPVVIGLLRYGQLLIVKGYGDSPTDLLLTDLFMIINVAVFVLMFGWLIYVT